MTIATGMKGEVDKIGSVDVIVPCYRYGQYLRECVASVLTQSVLEVRVLVLDDASPDNTFEVAAELARRDSRVMIHRHATNKGHIATYNEGLAWASADYTLLLSADDYLLAGALALSVQLMDAYPEVGFTFGNVIELSETGTATQVNPLSGICCETETRILAGREFMQMSGSRNIVPTPSAVVRTWLHKRLGGYRKELPHSADQEMWLRLAAHGMWRP